MSIDYLWFLYRVPPELDTRVKVIFDEGLARVSIGKPTEDTLAILEDGYSLDECHPFDISSFDEVLDSKTYLEAMLSFNAVAPAECLLYALGVERAQQLPAWHGNFLVSSASVADVEKMVRALLSEDANATLERARRMVSRRNSDPGEAKDLLAALPLALEHARLAGSGLLAFGTTPGD